MGDNPLKTFGSVAFLVNTTPDFLNACADFYGHLTNRGWSEEVLTSVFRQAVTAAKRKYSRTTATEEPLWDTSTSSSNNGLFVHWEYHPRDIPRKTIRQIFEETLAPVLTESGLPPRRLTIAYSTPRSLGSCLTKTQLKEPDDIRVSTYLESMEQPPANL